MAIVHLTDRSLKALEAGRYQTDFWDQGLQGFGVRVSTSGRKSFVVMYYAPGGGKRRFTLGVYPALGLADARQKAKEVLYDVARGNDPHAAKQARRRAETFEELAEEYLERHARPRKKSWKEDERLIEKELLPSWRGLKVADIQRRDVIQLLDSIVGRGAPIMANRTRALISTMFTFAIGRDIVEHNPTLGVARPGKERQRDRVLGEHQIRALWAVLDRQPQVMAGTFKMRLLTAQRGVEVLTMRWENIDGDWWTIPGEHVKNGLAHRVPLSPQTRALLEELRPVTGNSGWVFASPRIKGARIVAVQKAAECIAREAGIEFTPHDLRRTAASFMTSMGISRLVVAKILNHVESGVTAVYDRHSYDAEKRQALVRWGGRLEEILSGVARHNVVRIA